MIRFCIGHTAFAIAVFEPIPKPLLNLIHAYRLVAKHQSIDIHYRFTNTELWRDQQCLWRSDSFGDLLACFELDLYRQSIDRCLPRLLPFHAASIAWQQQGLLFAGHSGAGKSSLCTAALVDGAAYLSDEFTLLDEQGQLIPFARPLQWDGQQHPAFNDTDMRSCCRASSYTFKHANKQSNTSFLWHPIKQQTQAIASYALIFPHYDPQQSKAQIEAIPHSMALIHLASHRLGRQQTADCIHALQQRLRKPWQAYRLSFAHVKQAWQQLRQQLECS